MPDDDLGHLRELQRHLRSFENQFDSAQGNLRNTGSLWTLAGVGGLGGALALPAVTIMIGNCPILLDRWFFVSAVCFLVIVGLSNLWSLDQFVYQRLLHSVFAFGMDLEGFLPERERIRTAVNDRVSDVTGRLSNFYYIPIGIYLVVFVGANILQMAYAHMAVSALTWALFLGCLIWVGRMHWESKKDDVTAARKKK